MDGKTMTTGRLNPAYIELKCHHYTTNADQVAFRSIARLLPGGKTPGTKMLYCDVCRNWCKDPRIIKTVELPEEPMF